MINPAEDVDATLRDCEERAEARGLRWVSEARQGDAAKVLVDEPTATKSIYDMRREGDTWKIYDIKEATPGTAE